MTKEEFKANVVIDDNGCWIWQGALIGSGYGPHRKAYQAFVGPIPIGKIIRHTCDIKRCINFDHLVPGTYHENSMDCVERGRHARSRHGAPTTYSDDTIIEARMMYDEGYSLQQVADAFGMSKGYVSKLMNGQFRRNVA